MESGQSNSLQKVSPHSIFQRGMGLSHFTYAYAEYMEAQGKSSSYRTDPYSLAIQRLHISVIPESLPCRTDERHTIESYLRRGIGAQGQSTPIYICGMPGAFCTMVFFVVQMIYMFVTVLQVTV
jgi:hypothetical protein